MVNIGHSSMFMPLNLITQDMARAGHHANELTNQVMESVCRQTVAELADGSVFCIRQHKLKREEVAGAEYYSQSCSSVRAAYIIQDAREQPVLKVYHGMGTELQRDDVSSLVLTTKHMRPLGLFLRILIENYGPVDQVRGIKEERGSLMCQGLGE